MRRWRKTDPWDAPADRSPPLAWGWQLAANWGKVEKRDAMAVLDAASEPAI